MSVQPSPAPESRADLRAQCAVIAQYIRELASHGAARQESVRV